MNMFLFSLAVILMIAFIARDYMKKKYNIDTDKIEVSQIFSLKKSKRGIFRNVKNVIKRSTFIINKKTGTKSLIMMDAGANKVTVLATLRQITGLDHNTANQIVNSTPMLFMKNISEKEADLTKQALEFVGAKIEIK